MKSFGKRQFPGWNFCEYLLLRGVAGLINSLSIERSTAIARFLGNVLFLILPRRKKDTLKNLESAFPELTSKEREKLARENFRNLCISLMEFFRTPSMLAEASERFEIEGSEHMDEGLRKGRGIIFVVSHVGPWEYLAFLSYLKNYNFLVIVRNTRNPYIHKWIEGLRKRVTLTSIDRLHAARKVLKALKSNRVVSVLIDQWAGHEGIWVEFFGTSTSTTSLPARLAAHTGATLIPGYCIRLSPGKYKIIVLPEVPLLEGPDGEEKTTLKLNELLEDMIRKYPDQWTWTHRRWKSHDRFLHKKRTG